MGFELGKNSINNMAGIDDRLIDIAELAITLSPIDFGIPSSGGLRSIEDQAALYTSGKSKCDGRTMLQASAQLGYELKWGGLWKSWQDMPHFELRD